MFDAIKRLFGEGKIRFEADYEGGTVTIKVPYIGDINTLDEAEMIGLIKRRIFVEHGVHVFNVRMTGHY